jgi:hypothetical protein
MQHRGFRSGIAIGAAIGALLAAVSFCYLLAFEPAGLEVGTDAGVGMLMIGILLGAIFGWVFSRPRPTAEAVIGVPQRTSIRIVMWFTTAMALFFAVGAGRENSWKLWGGWALPEPGAYEQAGRPNARGCSCTSLVGFSSWACSLWARRSSSASSENRDPLLVYTHSLT